MIWHVAPPPMWRILDAKYAVETHTHMTKMILWICEKNEECILCSEIKPTLSLSLSIYILEPKWPLLLLEKALFWRVEAQK